MMADCISLSFVLELAMAMVAPFSSLISLVCNAMKCFVIKMQHNLTKSRSFWPFLVQKYLQNQEFVGRYPQI